MTFQKKPPHQSPIVGGGKLSPSAKGGIRKVPLLLFSVIFSSTLALAFLLLSGHSSAIGHGFDEHREDGKRRLRRQTLPFDNVRIYATNSNVSITDRVQVLSAQSRIQLLESHLNATIWSNGSLLQMSPNGEEVALSASQAIGLILAMFGGARVEGAGESLQLNESSRMESEDWHSRMEAELAGKAVNLSWQDADGTIALRALGARMAALVSLGWERPGKEEELSVLSAPGQGGGNGTREERELSIVADSPAYQVQIRLIGAETALQFLGARLHIPAPHRSLLLHWQGWLVQVQSLESPFEVRASAKELRVICYNEALTIRLSANSIGLDVGQLSRLAVNRSASPSSSFPSNFRINGGQISAANSSSIVDFAELISRQLHLSLSRDPQLGQSVLADSLHSQLKLAHSNRTSIFTAARHFVEMLGREPVLELLAGNVSVKMSAGRGGEGALETDILPRELLATNEEDIFGIGPIAPWPAFPSAAPPSASPQSRLPPIVRPVPSSSTAPSPSTPPPSTPSPSTLAPSLLVPTPLMARPDQLFTFRQSFPPPTPPSSPLPPIPQQQIDDAFPSPQAQIFTFPPLDSDFLVGQFETAAALVGQMPPSTAAPFPISATISSLQVPREGDGQLADDFPGIRRENRQFVWRPEEMLESAEKEEKGKRPAEKRKTRQLKMENEGAMLELEVDIGPEGDLHERRLREELARGMEEMLLKMKKSEGGGRIGVDRDKVQMEALENGNGNGVRVRFWVEGGGMGEMLGDIQDWRGRTLAGHQLLSAPRLLLPPPPSPPPQPKNPPIARSPAILAISAHSLPVLPIGFLALGLSLLAMIIGLRPLAKAILKLKEWTKRRKGGRNEFGN